MPILLLVLLVFLQSCGVKTIDTDRVVVDGQCCPEEMEGMHVMNAQRDDANERGRDGTLGQSRWIV